MNLHQRGLTHLCTQSVAKSNVQVQVRERMKVLGLRLGFELQDLESHLQVKPSVGHTQTIITIIALQHS